MTVREWLIAESVWWHRTRLGPSALRLVDGLPVNGPVGVEEASADAGRLSGTVLPGLRDAHVHSTLIDLRDLPRGGIVQVHDLGGPPSRLRALQRRAADRASALPALYFAGAFLTAPSGYPSDRSWASSGSWREVRSPLDATSAVDEQVAYGAEFIKIAMNANAGPVFDQYTLNALVDAAHAADLPVVVHAEGSDTVRISCDSGADRLAHIPWTERLDSGLVRDAAQRMSWISTLDIHGWGIDTTDLQTARHNARRFLECGGILWYGTDLGNGSQPSGVNAREISQLQALGLSPDDILTAMIDPVTVTSLPLCWIPGGLADEPSSFAASLATARVLNEQAE